MSNPNVPRYHPDLEVNVDTSKEQKNYKEVQDTIVSLRERNQDNHDILKNLEQIHEKVVQLQANKEPIPTTILEMLSKLEQNQKLSVISQETISRIFK